MSWIFVLLLGVSFLASILTGSGAALGAAVPQGAQAGVTLSISIAGSLCLWSGVGKLMEEAGLTKKLSRFLIPVIGGVFPSARKDPAFASAVSANICANFLGLGNAATPMGIRAAKLLARGQNCANGELCRLIVLNTASIQLIPATVAAVRANLGADAPFDILPAVWITSLCSAGLGLTAAWILEKLWRK